ncbi:XrtA/PEP-CTERM system TPR-repeat protein PrsT [Massilia oculi]|uniref:XrtA/PEP-CTERM system TPR-repeat protein PrsT n=1 Tax=Massilia oculi TaxID=945844 RepID=UPI001AAFAF8A|nr:XrtA/PEP-CTERM system TPR-repeat protein PrsT [Massilia oculi]
MPRHPTKLKLTAAILTGALLTVGLAGCNRTQSTETLLAEASEYQQKGDIKAALIQLKNAVANSPEDGEARLALGTLQLSTGDNVSAEKELGRARSLGIAEDRVLPLLGRTLAQQGKFKELLELITPEKAGKSAPLLSLRGDALLGSGKPDEAKQAYEAALAANANSGDALMGLARLSAVRGERDAALLYVDQAVAKDPKNPEVFIMQGAMLRSMNKQDEALSAYDKALALKPDHRGAHIEKAYIEIARGKFDAAKKEVEAAEKNSPGSLLVVYTRALYEFSQGKHSAAKDALAKILKVAPNHYPSILLAGASELQLGGTQQAEQHLRKYLEANPNNVYARKLLAQAQLRNSQPADAAATLAPALKEAPQDAQLLALAGESYMQVRDFDKASNYLQQAATLAPEAAAVRTSLGLSRLAQGDQARALSDLEMAATLDPKSLQATMALVQTEINMKRYDKALAAVNALEKQQPDSAQVQQLKGAVYMVQNKNAEARTAFEKALSLQPSFLPAVTNLARLDVQDKKPDAAKARFTAFLDKNKDNVEAMTALAELAMLQKNTAEATSWYEKASAAQPNATAPSLKLGAHYLATEQAPKALALARKLQTTHPTDAGVLELLGQSQAANKDLNGALDTYSKLVNVLPKAPGAQLRLAQVQLALKNESAAAGHLKRAVDLQPDFVPARLMQVDLALRAKRPDEALAVARELQKAAPKAPVGHVIEGDVLMSQQKFAQAQQSYEKGLALARSSELTVKVMQAMQAGGKSKEALARGQAWLAAQPDDVRVSLLVAELNLSAKDYKGAIAKLENAQKRAPEHPLVLNNLAWAYQQVKDPRALATAEKAYKLASDSPGVMDTLGWVLVEQGDTARGLPLLQKASSQAPNSMEIRYHLAQALHKSGDKAGARRELDKLLAPGTQFAHADEARALLKSL